MLWQIENKQQEATNSLYQIIVCLTSINLQKKILKNPVFKSTICFLDVY